MFSKREVKKRPDVTKAMAWKNKISKGQGCRGLLSWGMLFPLIKVDLGTVKVI